VALAVVQTQKSAGHAAATSRTTTFSPATTAGNLLVAVFCGALTNVTDPTPPANWVKRVGGIGTTSFGIWLYELPNNAGGITSVQFTHGGSVSAVSQLYLYEISGAATTAPIDQTGSVTSGASATTKTDTCSAPNTNANDIVISGYMLASATANTFTDTTSGYTQTQTDTIGETGAVSHKIVSAIETSADSPTVATAKIWDMVIATYQAAAAPVGRPRPPMIIKQAVNRAGTY
jgi:hypothetical protein